MQVRAWNPIQICYTIGTRVRVRANIGISGRATVRARATFRVKARVRSKVKGPGLELAHAWG